MKADWLGISGSRTQWCPWRVHGKSAFSPHSDTSEVPLPLPGSDVTEVMSVKSQAFTTNCLEVSKIIHLIKNQEDLKLNGERQPTDTKPTWQRSWNDLTDFKAVTSLKMFQWVIKTCLEQMKNVIVSSRKYKVSAKKRRHKEEPNGNLMP